MLVSTTVSPAALGRRWAARVLQGKGFAWTAKKGHSHPHPKSLPGPGFHPLLPSRCPWEELHY